MEEVRGRWFALKVKPRRFWAGRPAKRGGRRLDSVAGEADLGTDGSMKTTVDLPEKELAEAMRHTGAKTKTEAVSRAVADFNRRQRLGRLADRLGTCSQVMSQDELVRMRASS